MTQPPQVVTTYAQYERFLIVDSQGNMRVLENVPREMKPSEVAFALKVMVPKTRIPMPAGQILLRLPELHPAGIEVMVENAPVKLGLPRPHMFEPADLNDTVCTRCGLSRANPSHRCVAPECRNLVTVERDDVPYCAEHDPQQEDKHEQ